MELLIGAPQNRSGDPARRLWLYAENFFNQKESYMSRGMGAGLGCRR